MAGREKTTAQESKGRWAFSQVRTVLYSTVMYCTVL